MILRTLTPDHPDIPAVKKLFEEAFPVNERSMDMDEILAHAEQLPIRLLGIYPEEAPEDFAGFFLTVEGGDFVYLTYLAICPEKRSGGIGSKAMNAVREYYKDQTLLFSYESIYEKSNNPEQRERRRNLYLRLGFHETGWFSVMNGTEFIIASSKEEFDKDAFLEFMGAMSAGTTGAAVPELYRRD